MTILAPPTAAEAHVTTRSLTTGSITETFTGSTSQRGSNFKARVVITVVKNVVQRPSYIQFLTSDGQCYGGGLIGSFGPTHFNIHSPLKDDTCHHGIKFHWRIGEGMTAKNTANLRFSVNPKAG